MDDFKEASRHNRTDVYMNSETEAVRKETAWVQALLGPSSQRGYEDTIDHL